MGYGRDKKLYRSRSGKFLGVCKGVAEWLGWPTGLVRLAVVVIALVTAVIPTLLIYLLAAVILSPEPEDSSWDEEDFYRNCRYAWKDLRRNVNNEYQNIRSKFRES